MLVKFLFLLASGLFFLHLTGGNSVYAESFQVTIPLGATTSNIGEPYIPSTITVPVNSSITWTNNDSAVHTVTSANETSDSRPFDSGLLSQGQNFKVTFNKTGVYPYQCMLHPFMTGNVNVGINTSASETASNASSVRNAIEPKDQNMVEEGPITLTAQEINGAYVWEKDGKNNPTLNMLSGKQYNFTIRSLITDPAEHEFKIVLPNGEDIVESEEVEEGEQTALSFIPPATPVTLRYYCEYHPDSMVGIINIAGK
jgi:plastocyanin